MTVNLKSIVSKQLPEFVREDYPLFVAFIEAYYEYMNTIQKEKRNLTELRDIDQTVDDYIQYFKNELDIFGDNYAYIDQKLFLRKIKQLFVAKGIEASYKLLLKILFNKTAQISYPWDSVLKASDGKWQQDMSIFVDISEGDANDLVGNRIDIVSENIVIKVFVDRVKYIKNSTIYEVFINKNYYGTIQVGYDITFGSTTKGNLVTGTIIPTTIGYSITEKSSGYKVGDLLRGTTVSGGQSITQLLKVTKVDTNGGVLAIQTIKFGCGYDAGFYLLQSRQSISSNSTIEVSKESTLQYLIPNDTIVEQYSDYGYVIRPDYSEVDYDDPTYAGTTERQFYQESISGQGVDPDYLLINFSIGAVAKYQGFYASNDGFLDDTIVLQDSYRYQKFSYLVTIDEKLESYKSLIKSYLHPAGTMLFGEYQIQNEYAPGLTVTQELQEYQSLST